MAECTTCVSPVVIIAGANRGIGLGLVRALIKGDYNFKCLPSPPVVIATARDVEHATDLKDLVKQHGDRLHVMSLDVGDEESIKTFAMKVAREFNRVDVYIHNAGVIEADIDSTTATLVQSEALNIMRVNSIGPVLLTQQLMPLLVSTQARFHNDQNPVRCGYVSSSMGSFASTDKNTAYCPSYKASKAALNMYVKILTIEHPTLSFAAIHPGTSLLVNHLIVTVWIQHERTSHSFPSRSPRRVV